MGNSDDLMGGALVWRLVCEKNLLLEEGFGLGQLEVGPGVGFLQ